MSGLTLAQAQAAAAAVVRDLEMFHAGRPMWYVARDCVLVGIVLGLLLAWRRGRIA